MVYSVNDSFLYNISTTFFKFMKLVKQPNQTTTLKLIVMTYNNK